MLRRRRCGPCCSPFPGMRDIYTAVQIREQSAAALTARARVNDGRTATAGCELRLARAVARALGNFVVNEIIGWTGAPPWAVRGYPATSNLFRWKAGFSSRTIFTRPPLSATIHVSDMGRDGG